MYDGYGRISQIRLSEDEADATGDLVRTYAYSATGDLLNTKDYREFLNDGDSYIKTAYERNGAGITNKITYSDHENGADAGVTKEQYTYTFDGRGFVDSEKAYTNYGTAGTVNKSYEYDDVGRLTKATIGNKTKTYTYDAVGNRLTMTESGTTYTYGYNQFNQLESIKKGSDADYARYQYDDRGNQRHEYIKKDFDGTTKEQHTEYTYNLLNRLTTATITAPGETTQNVISAYNAVGKRISKEEYEGATVEDKDTTLYYYTGDEVLFTTTDAAFMLTENILDPGGSIVASKRFADPFDGNYYFYNYDLRGSVTSIIVPTDIALTGGGTLQGGSRVTDYTYDEFGNLEKGGVQEFLNETTYTGSVSDTSTGLQYMNARYYDPETGRFLTQDTYTGNPYDPWTQHLYAYCGNNPTSMVDPTGHLPVLLIPIGALLAGMLGGAAAEGVGDLIDDGQINRPWQDYLSNAFWGGLDGISFGTAKVFANAARLYGKIASTAGKIKKAAKAEKAAQEVLEQGVKGAGKVITSADDVAAYIHKNGKLPSNYITKSQAKKLGWNAKEGNLAKVAPGKSIGGYIQEYGRSITGCSKQNMV